LFIFYIREVGSYEQFWMIQQPERHNRTAVLIPTSRTTLHYTTKRQRGIRGNCPTYFHQPKIKIKKDDSRKIGLQTLCQDLFFLHIPKKKEDAVYCKACFLFFHEGVGKGAHEAPGKLNKEIACSVDENLSRHVINC
ncbi:hypothetical protein L9F63_012426, partial [Diploptera punctata]